MALVLTLQPYRFTVEAYLAFEHASGDKVPSRLLGEVTLA
jgi:hypothetical protein